MFLQSFPNGILYLPKTAPAMADAASVWIEQPVHGLLVLAEAVVILFFLRDILFIMPPSLACFQKWQRVVSVEHNIPWARTRDRVALCLFPAYVLMVQWSGIWTVDLWWIAIGLAGYDWLRKILYYLVPHRRVSDEYWQACRNTPVVFSLPLAFLWMVSMMVLLVCGAVESVSGAILLAELACFLMISLVRQAEILSHRVGAFQSFLYLCGLEFVPVTGLVIVVLLLR